MSKLRKATEETSRWVASFTYKHLYKQTNIHKIFYNNQYSQWLLPYSVIHKITIKITNYFKWEQEIPLSNRNKHETRMIETTSNATGSHIKALLKVNSDRTHILPKKKNPKKTHHFWKKKTLTFFQKKTPHYFSL